MTSHYIVSGPGRVGGHLVLGVLLSAGVTATRTHDPDFSFGCDPNTVLILVDRRDRFAAIMSNCLVWHTGQSTDYERSPEPFDVDPGQFDYLYYQHVNYYDRHDFNRPFAGVERLYFEDFVTDLDVIYARLHLPQIIEPNARQDEITRLLHRPAPYKYTETIRNWQILQGRFRELQSMAL